MSLTKAADARALRRKFHNRVRASVTELASTLLDPDLAPEAKVRRAAPARQAIAEAFEEIERDGRKLIDQAKAEYLALAPSALRLAAAFKDPGRAAAMRQLSEGMQPPELLALARMAAAALDGAAAFGIAAGLAARLDADREPLVGEAFKVLAAWKADERAEARADLIVAHSEIEHLTLDRRAAEGHRVDALELLQVANRLGALSADQSSVSDEQRQASYQLAGLEFKLSDPAVLPSVAFGG